MSATQGRAVGWWLLATPVSGMATGAVLGALLGLSSTQSGDEIGPLTGSPVAPMLAGAVLGLLVGAFGGLILGLVLAQVVGTRPASAGTRAAAAGIGLVGCPLVLLVLVVVSRVDLENGVLPVLAVAGGAGGIVCRWLVGRPGRDRSLALHSGAPVTPR